MQSIRLSFIHLFFRMKPQIKKTEKQFLFFQYVSKTKMRKQIMTRIPFSNFVLKNQKWKRWITSTHITFCFLHLTQVAGARSYCTGERKVQFNQNEVFWLFLDGEWISLRQEDMFQVMPIVWQKLENELLSILSFWCYCI